MNPPVQNQRKRISIILPAFNEEGNVIPFYDALVKVADSELGDYDVEVIYVDDGSVDRTLAKIKSLVQKDSRVKGLSFSRNFGHQAALTAGMEKASGDAIITMDCDLQDPPELISPMVQKWEEGNKIVHARRTARSDRLFKKVTASLYYKLLGKVSDVHIPQQVGDFRLMDRIVLDNLMRLDEHARYLRGMVAWLGFKHDFVDFERPERIHGETHYPLTKMIRLAMDGLLNFTFVPLRVGLWIGILSIFGSLYFLGYISYYHFIRGVDYQLYKWINVILFGFMGVQFIFIWIVGEYVGRIYNDVRRRPLFVIAEEIINADSDLYR